MPTKSERPAKLVERRGKIHFHIDNHRPLGPVFQVTPPRLNAALKRYPRVAKKLHITVSQDGKGMDRHLKTADALFAWKMNLKKFAERAPKLRWVQAPGAGINHLLPLDWLPKGAVLTNNSGVHGERANEYGIMAILMLNNRLPEMMTNQRRARWDQLFNSGIAGKTLLVVGVGNVGGGIARSAKKFGLHVIGIRRTGKSHRYVDRMYRPSDLHLALPLADFVFVAAPSTPDTRHLIGRKELNLLKRGAGIVSYSRADTMDYDALRKKLVKRHLSAVLDGFDPEPLPKSSPLWSTPNLIITPHCSSDDTEVYTPATLDLTFRNMERFIAGKPLLNRIDPKLGY